MPSLHPVQFDGNNKATHVKCGMKIDHKYTLT